MDTDLFDEASLLVDVRFPSTSGFLAALNSIKPAATQVALVTFSAEGLSLKWEHASKALQSGVFLGHALFSSYVIRQEVEFGLTMLTLLNTLGVLETEQDGDLCVRYPGPNGELLLESIQPPPPADFAPSAGSQHIDTHPSIYARLATQERTHFYDLLDHFSDVNSHFIAPGNVLKETMDDLEWTQGEVCIQMKRDPPSLIFSSSKNGVALDVDIPSTLLSGFHCASASLKWEYRGKYLRTVFSHAGGQRGHESSGGGVTSKVSIDDQGLFKATHMLKIQLPESQDAVGSAVQGGGGGGLEATAPRLAVAQFALLPLSDEVAEEGDADVASHA